MDQCCDRCGRQFDDSTEISVCPHYVSESVYIPPAVSTKSTVNELVAEALLELANDYFIATVVKES